MARFARTGTRVGAYPSSAWRVGLLFLAGCSLAGAATAAGLYKYTDASGRVVYTDVPPPGNVNPETVKAMPAANPNAARELVNKEAEFKKRQQQRADDAAAEERAKAEAARRAQSCAQTRGTLKGLRDESLPHYRMNEAGERTLLDAQMRRQEIDRLEKHLREHC